MYTATCFSSDVPSLGSHQSKGMKDVSRLVDITARDDFIGLCDQKFHINMSPILDGYGLMAIF